MLESFCAGTGRQESHQRGKGRVPKVPSAGCTGEDWIKKALSSQHLALGSLIGVPKNKKCFSFKLFNPLELSDFNLDIISVNY
jgi:hypothetical protein